MKTIPNSGTKANHLIACFNTHKLEQNCDNSKGGDSDRTVILRKVTHHLNELQQHKTLKPQAKAEIQETFFKIIFNLYYSSNQFRYQKKGAVLIRFELINRYYPLITENLIQLGIPESEIEKSIAQLCVLVTHTSDQTSYLSLNYLPRELAILCKSFGIQQNRGYSEVEAGTALENKLKNYQTTEKLPLVRIFKLAEVAKLDANSDSALMDEIANLQQYNHDYVALHKKITVLYHKLALANLEEWQAQAEPRNELMLNFGGPELLEESWAPQNLLNFRQHLVKNKFSPEAFSNIKEFNLAAANCPVSFAEYAEKDKESWSFCFYFDKNAKYHVTAYQTLSYKQWRSSKINSHLVPDLINQLPMGEALILTKDTFKKLQDALKLTPNSDEFKTRLLEIDNELVLHEQELQLPTRLQALNREIRFTWEKHATTLDRIRKLVAAKMHDKMDKAFSIVDGSRTRIYSPLSRKHWRRFSIAPENDPSFRGLFSYKEYVQEKFTVKFQEVVYGSNNQLLTSEQHAVIIKEAAGLTGKSYFNLGLFMFSGPATASVHY